MKRTHIIILILFYMLLSPSFIKVYGGPIEIIDNAISEIDNFVRHFISVVMKTTLNIMRIAYTAMIAVGILLWATGIESYRAKKLIIGALVLAAAVESLGGL